VYWQTKTITIECVHGGFIVDMVQTPFMEGELRPVPPDTHIRKVYESAIKLISDVEANLKEAKSSSG